MILVDRVQKMNLDGILRQREDMCGYDRSCDCSTKSNCYYSRDGKNKEDAAHALEFGLDELKFRPSNPSMILVIIYEI